MRFSITIVADRAERRALYLQQDKSIYKIFTTSSRLGPRSGPSLRSNGELRKSAARLKAACFLFDFFELCWVGYANPTVYLAQRDAYRARRFRFQG